ncbi:multidrug effflux MFS transporter [uncultured Mailhella sp.]|uniref:multidrug effflux MFS transporter n=1 Tax=uncultured Mailhella sp. TaxID=1981031 RepID=UPI0025ED233F|nr:multidrug effflux MFS transporter [uncultured Mailhella sp.]
MSVSPFKSTGARLFMASVLGFLAAMGPLCTDFYLPALPDMAAELGSAPSQMQLSITACLLGLSLGQIVLGPLSDARGRKWPLLVSLAVFIVASFLCSRASSVGELIALRFIQGLAGSGGVVLSRAIACDLFRGTELTKFFSLLMLINGVAPIFGPVIGGQILRFSSWGGIFVFLAVCGAAQFSLVLFGCPETLPADRRIQGGMGQSVRAMLRLFENRTFLCYMLIQGFVMAGFFGYISASPFVLQNLYGLSAQQYALCFGLNGIGIMLFAQITGRVCMAYGDRTVLGAGVALSLIASLGIVVVSVLHLPVPFMIGSLFLFVSCIGITTTTSFSLAIAAQTEGAGSASGLLGVTSFVFGAAASPLVGLGGDSTSLPMAVVAVISGLLVLLFFRMAARTRREAKRSE